MTYSSLAEESILDVFKARVAACPKCCLSLPPLADGTCRGCNRLKNQRTYLMHRHERNKRIAEDRKRNPEKYRRQRRKSYAKNREKEAARKARWYQARKETADLYV